MSDEAVLAAACDLIARYESFVGHVYTDGGGVETIGYGETDPRIITAYRAGMTEAEARRLLSTKVAATVEKVRGMVKVALTDNQVVALTSLAYNIGVDGLRNSTALARINKGDYAGGAEAMKLWIKDALGQVENGLVTRRNTEAALFLSQGVTPPIPVPPPPLAHGFTYIVDGEDWLWLGVERMHVRCGSAAVLTGLRTPAVLAHIGPQDAAFHRYLQGVAANAGFTG